MSFGFTQNSSPEPGRNKSVPAGKRVLNTHVSVTEHEHLKRAASAEGWTVTMYLRHLIRKDMSRKRR